MLQQVELLKQDGDAQGHDDAQVGCLGPEDDRPDHESKKGGREPKGAGGQEGHAFDAAGRVRLRSARGGRGSHVRPPFVMPKRRKVRIEHDEHEERPDPEHLGAEHRRGDEVQEESGALIDERARGERGEVPGARSGESGSEPSAILRPRHHADALSRCPGRSPVGDERRIKGGERALLKRSRFGQLDNVACRTARRSTLSISASRLGSRTQKMARIPRMPLARRSTIRKLPTTANTYVGIATRRPARRENPSRRSGVPVQQHLVDEKHAVGRGR